MTITKLIKTNQNLYSWNWFYLNSNDNLMVSRYPKEVITKTKYDGSIRKDIILPGIEYSVRYKEDREKAKNCQLLITENQEKLNILFKNKE